MNDFLRLVIDEFNEDLTGHFILDRIILVKISCLWRLWQLVYIRLVITLRRIIFFSWPRSAFICFCAFSKVTATISIYIIRLLVFLTETPCLLRGTNCGYTCICTVLLVLEIKCCYMSCCYLPASLFGAWEKFRWHRFCPNTWGFPLSVSFKIHEKMKS